MKHIDSFPIADSFPYDDALVKDLNEHSKQHLVGKPILTVSEDGSTLRCTKVKVIDGAEFIKVFKDSIKTVLHLSSTAQKMLLYFMDILTINNATVFLDIKDCMTQCQFKTRKSVYDGLSELLEKEILTRTPFAGKFWVNPIVVFRGERIDFHNSFIKSNE